MLESYFKLYPVEDRETISRFLIKNRENNNYATKGKVHNRAFEPSSLSVLITSLIFEGHFPYD